MTKNSRTKFRSVYWVLLVIAGAGLSLAVFNFSQNFQKDRLTENAFERLKLFHSLRKAALEDYVDSVTSEISAISISQRTREALTKLQTSWSTLGSNPSRRLQDIYISKNPFPKSDRQRLVIAEEKSEYGTIHENFHPYGRELLKHFGYYDLFLIDVSGNILYTVAKEDDFATNIRTGTFSDTHLQLVFDQALKRRGKRISLSDFERYAPSNGEPAAFAGKAIVDQFGNPEGVLAVQLPKEPINQLLQFSEGLGQTGETYIVGTDQLMRSQSRFIKDSTLLRTKVDTIAANRGIAGFGGAEIIDDYRGERVLSVFAPVDFFGNRWVLIAEQDENEVLSGRNVWISIAIGGATGLALVLMCLIVYLFHRRSKSNSLEI